MTCKCGVLAAVAQHYARRTTAPATVPLSAHATSTTCEYTLPSSPLGNLCQQRPPTWYHVSVRHSGHCSECRCSYPPHMAPSTCSMTMSASAWVIAGAV